MPSANPHELLKIIDENVIGRYRPVDTPFGRKPLVYADYTASGRSLQFIERQIAEQVLPFYANTHSETSFTGAQTTAFREEARELIKQAINAGTNDKLIFCGSGATAAINRLIDMLGLRLPHDLDKRYSLAQAVPAAERPVIFLGPYEHHSNELPWRETLADVVPIPLCPNGLIDRAQLEQALVQYRDRPLRIGSFSAASNVTGVRSDITGITQLLKEHGALAFWDFAAAAPYVGIDMNVTGAEIDAAFISTHKFIGGPGTPGILAIKDALATNTVPAIVGGGTVAFVAPDGHRYLDDPERREEGGTPAVVESIRAGLVFRLQQAVGSETIEALERKKVASAIARLGGQDNIEILGPTDADRLSIFSLRFFHNGAELHYGFVTALLNDLFGIQARGGCSCAGPYGHTLLSIDPARSRALDARVAVGEVALRPGWVRLNFNYFIGDAEFDYLLSALELVAEHGWRLLPLYELDARGGLWRHRDMPRKRPAALADMPLFDTSNMDRRDKNNVDFLALLNEAESILLRGASAAQCARACTDGHLDRGGRSFDEALRWFLLPEEIGAETTASSLRASA